MIDTRLFNYKTIENGDIMSPVNIEMIKGQDLVIMKQETAHKPPQEVTVNEKTLKKILKELEKNKKDKISQSNEETN